MTIGRVIEAIVRRLPRRICLDSDLHIYLRGRKDEKLFRSIFTSSEYMLFVPKLLDLEMPLAHVIDCGAGIGLFSLLIEHLRRIKILNWQKIHYTLIEPSSFNLKILKKNIRSNLSQSSYEIIKGAVGQKGGYTTFYESRKKPFHSNIIENKFCAREKVVPFIDLTSFLKKENIILKLDVQGAEFPTLKTYENELSNIKSLIIEWHKGYGDMKFAESMLNKNGLFMSKNGGGAKLYER